MLHRLAAKSVILNTHTIEATVSMRGPGGNGANRGTYEFHGLVGRYTLLILRAVLAEPEENVVQKGIGVLRGGGLCTYMDTR